VQQLTTKQEYNPCWIFFEACSDKNFGITLLQKENPAIISQNKNLNNNPIINQKNRKKSHKKTSHRTCD
jgi:hypothetical protein